MHACMGTVMHVYNKLVKLVIITLHACCIVIKYRGVLISYCIAWTYIASIPAAKKKAVLYTDLPSIHSLGSRPFFSKAHACSCSSAIFGMLHLCWAIHILAWQRHACGSIELTGFNYALFYEVYIL